MFNTKRIIFLIGILSLVTLTGALLAGPAFAAKKEKGNGNDGSKTLICHYQEFEAAVLGVDEFGAEFVITEEQRAEWAVINIDDKALPAHLGDGAELLAHVDGDGYSDFIIDDTDVDEFDVAITTNDTSECDRLVLSTLEVEVD